MLFFTYDNISPFKKISNKDPNCDHQRKTKASVFALHRLALSHMTRPLCQATGGKSAFV